MHSPVRRRAKIVCTLGPSSQSEEALLGLIEDGLDVARLNFSHGTHDFHRGLIERIRSAAKKAGKPVAIMQDLQGPKLRAGKLPAPLELKAGEILLLYPEGSKPCGATEGKTPVPISAEIAEAVSKDVQVGSRILFDDGKISTRVSSVSPPEITVEVENGGTLSSNKGMNLPGTPLSLSCLTEKDIEDLKFGIAQGVDAIALSFVRSAKDIEELRAILDKECKVPPLVVAKIEREEAIDGENMNAIIDAVDCLLIARGDMAVEIGAQRVPTVQKHLIHACNEKGVPVITATQMLESMISSPTPTRAEASDVANAVYDGTDAVMLSAETASGQYPRESVRTMARIILEAERARHLYSRHKDLLPRPGSSIADSIEFSASRIAQHVGATCIACLTHSGMAARILSKYRPVKPIVAIMDNEAMLRRLSFNWGVRGVLIEKILGTDDLFHMVERVLQDNGWAEREDLVVVTAGVPTLKRGTTNMVKVHKIGAQIERQGPVMF